MVKTCFQTTFTNDLREKRLKLNSVLKYLKDELPDLTDDDLFDLRVIYDELLTNAIIHGNKLDSQKKVELFIEIDPGVILSIMRDEGTGFDYSNLFKSTEISDHLYYEHGRGFQLVFALADFIEWNNAGNEITIHKNY